MEESENLKSGPFSAEEDKIIMRRDLEQSSYRLGEKVEMVVKQDLGRDLNRNPKHVHEHWTRALEHVLTRYEKGRTDMIPSQLLL